MRFFDHQQRCRPRLTPRIPIFMSSRVKRALQLALNSGFSLAMRYLDIIVHFCRLSFLYTGLFFIARVYFFLG